jgi:hypothetical protein
MDMLEEIEESQIPVSFAISNGDLVLSGYNFQYENYISMIDRVNFPIFNVKGNHELYADNGPENYQKYFGDDHFNFTYGPLFISLFPDCFQLPETTSWGHKIDYTIKQEDIDQLQNDLNNLGPEIKYRLFFTHVPIQIDGAASHYDSYCIYYNYHQSEIDQLRNIFESNNFQVVGFSHWHDYDLFKYNGIHYVLAGGAGAPLYHDANKPSYDPPNYAELNHYVVFTFDRYGGILLQVILLNRNGIPDNNYTIRINSSTTGNPPSKIDSLRIFDTKWKGQYTLSWFATGENGITGSAESYIVKYANKPIKTEADFNNALTIPQNPVWQPQEAGAYEEHSIEMPTDLNDTYYFAIRAIDTEGQKSDISNNTILVPKSYIKRAFPNPFNSKKNRFFEVTIVPSKKTDVEFNLYTVNGRCVYSDTKSGNIGEELNFSWDGKNKTKMVAAGIYFYTVKIDTEILKGKAAFIQ